MTWLARTTELLRNLIRFPWLGLFITLRERLREDRLGVTAGSLTFTTIIALVPFITVALAVFTAFPMFSRLQEVMQKWLVESLIPDNIARQVLGALTLFAAKASKLGVAGVAVLLATALSLVLTIDHTLNRIWRVRRPRPLGQKIFIYWAAMTLGPLLLAASLSITSYLISASRGVVGALPGGVPLLLDTVEFFVLAAGVAAMYHFVPNTRVEWRHAWVGGLFVATALELAKKVLALYLKAVPTYSMVYGAFATVPIMLVWIYTAWLIVLLGAIIAAYLPSLQAGVVRRRSGTGWQFRLALQVLQTLHRAQRAGQSGMAAVDLGQNLRVDQPQLVSVLETLAALEWVGQFQPTEPGLPPRWAVLVDPVNTRLQPLVEVLLMAPAERVEAVWREFALMSLQQAFSDAEPVMAVEMT